MGIGTYISIITLNVNGLNAATKRHRLAKWIQKQNPCICCLQKTHFGPRDTYRLKVRGWKKYSMQIEIKRKQEQQYFSDKIDFKIETLTIDNDKFYNMRNIANTL